jgi:hypothetical protein
MVRSKKAFLELSDCSPTWLYDTNWFSSNVESAAKGLLRMDYQLQGFKLRDLDKLPLHRSTIVKGSIRSVRMALYYLGLPQPENIDIPDCLNKYTHRRVWKTTLGAIRRRKTPVFIKPATIQKAFRGHVYENGSFLLTKNLPDKFEVLASEVVFFDTEWRVYVLKGEIQGVFGYEGCGFGVRSPATKVLQQMISDFKDAPVAYAMDVGKLVRPKEKPVLSLIEINDGFSLGNYGLSHIKYAKMVEARWKEMVSAR